MSLESRRLRTQALPEDVSYPAQKMLERIRAIRRLMPTLGPQSRLAAEQEADRLLAEWEGHLRMHADYTEALRRHFGGRIQAAVDDVRQSALTQ